MQRSSSLVESLNENGITEKLSFHWSVYCVCFCAEDTWVFHTNGRAPISRELKKSNIHDSAKDKDSFEFVARCKRPVGNQKKLLEIAVEKNLCIFSFVLCDTKMTSHSAVSDHSDDVKYETEVEECRKLEGAENTVVNGENLSEKPEVHDNGSLQEADHSDSDHTLKNANHSDNVKYETKVEECQMPEWVKNTVVNGENLPEKLEIHDNGSPLKADRSDSDQTLKNAVEVLCKFFRGALKCVNCQRSIAVNPSTVMNHLHDCLSKEEQKESVTADTKDIRERLRALLQNVAVGNTSPIDDLQNQSVSRKDERPSTVSVFRVLATDSTRVSVTEPQIYECLKCDMTGGINKWEEHVINHHGVSPTNSGNDRNNECIVCLCTFCRLLIFGQREDVVKHEHFKVEDDYIFFPFSSYPHLKEVLDCKHQLPKYYKCLQKPASGDSVKLAFYCLPCDVFELEKSRHFLCKGHQRRRHLGLEFQYCAVCSVLFYADQSLLEDHRRSPSHILLKFAMKPNTIRPIADFVSKSHEDLLSGIKTKVLKDWITQPSNCRGSVAFWCEPCAYVTEKKEEWRNVHLTSETHAAQAEDECFEHMCALCRVSLFGSPEFHAAHCSSEGHKNMKTKVFHDLNIKRMASARSSICGELRAVDEKLLTVDDENNDETGGDNNKPNLLLKHLPVLPSKVSVTTPVTLDEKTYHLNNDPYFQILDSSVTVDKELLKQFLEKIIQRHGSFGRVRTYHCAFCDYYSSERSWWAHLGYPEHHIAYLNKMKKKKGKTALIMFCSRCSFFGFGSHIVRKTHLKNVKHKRICASAKSTNSVTSHSSPVSFCSTTDDDENVVKKTPIACPATCTTNMESTNVSGVNSSDDEKNEVENTEDELYDMIMRAGSDAEKPVNSDDEDKSKPDEVKSCTVLKKNSDEEAKKEDVGMENRENIEKMEYSIVVSGIPRPVLKNRAYVKEAFSQYISFDRSFVKKTEPGDIYLVVSKDIQKEYECLRKNLMHLMARWGTDELSVRLNSEEKSEPIAMRETLLEKAVQLFSNKQELFNAVTHMINLYDAEATSSLANGRIHELLLIISRLATHIYRQYNIIVKTHVFGSRITGLAVPNSDVDVYLQIGASFRGLISNNVELQQQLVVLFAKEMKCHPGDFRDVVSIPFARVPIVKFKHIQSNLNCDLSFKSGLSTMNSILVKTYLELDGRIKYIVCAVKLWMKLNDLADRNLFTTYAQIWMVLFFLMQADIAVVPTVIKLKNMLPPDQQILTVEGWNCSFPSIRHIVWRSSCKLTGEELVHRFFVFYSNPALINYVLCTLTGLKLEKKHFVDHYDSLPETFGTFKRRILEDPTLFRKVMCDFESFCVQDPFDHCHNLTKTINARKFLTFIELCKQTAVLLET